MTRIVTCGYETGDVNELGASTTGSNGVIAVVTSTPTPRSPGTYCLKCTGASAVAQSYKTINFGGNKTDVWIRFGCFIHPVPGPTEVIFATILDSASGAQANLTYTASDGLIRARQGPIVTGTLLGSASVAMSADAWHTIEWRHQMTSATVGITQVWLDGAQIINFSGDNTSTANVNVAYLQLGVTATGTNTGYYQAFDDIAVNDTSGTVNNGQIGDGRVVLLKPNGAGSNTNQTRGGTDSGANWSQVDELPPSFTDYVYAATAGVRDTYALENVPGAVSGWPVNSVDVIAYAQNSDASAGSLGLTIKSGATTNEGTAQALVTGAQYYRQLYETDPNTSATWTVSALDALEAGTTVR